MGNIWEIYPGKLTSIVLTAHFETPPFSTQQPFFQSEISNFRKKIIF